MASNNNNYKQIECKVSPESFELLIKLCARQGLSVYEFLQMVVDTLIRYMDDHHNMTEEMERAMNIFDHMVGWKDAVNLADVGEKRTVHEATYFFSDYKTGDEGKKRVKYKTGCRAVHVEVPELPGGEILGTYNIQEILEKTFCLMLPERYQRLRTIAAELGTDSLLSCVDLMMLREGKEQDLRELRRPFEDNRRTVYGDEDLNVYLKRQQRGADNLKDRHQILGEGDLWDKIESGTNDEEEADDAQ